MALNVLVVDDSAIMRQMIIKTLGLCGVPLGEIFQAGNGREGLDCIGQNWIDLVLVDINMPVMTGEEMVEEIRANPETTSMPVIVVSTESSATRIEMLQSQGAGFVHKPFSPETLRDAIIDKTGVSDEQLAGNEALSGDGPDF